MQRFLNKSAIVTGAASGLGKAIGERFLKEGATVALIDLNQTRLQETLEQLKNEGLTNVTAFVGDITDPVFVQNAVNDIFARKGVDILVNCAGVVENEEMTKISVTSWDRILDVHLKGTFLMTQAVSQKMISTSPPALPPSRSITNISSIVGKTGSRGLAHYACAKSGIVGFTKTVSQELGFKYGIRCNCILPGFIDTPMTKSYVSEAIAGKLLKQIPLGRFGKPQDIASTVAFLSSKDADYITGAAIEVTGGLGM